MKKFVITSPKTIVSEDAGQAKRGSTAKIFTVDGRRFNLDEVKVTHQQVYDPQSPNEEQKPNTLITSFIVTEMQRVDGMDYKRVSTCLYQSLAQLEPWEKFDFHCLESRMEVILHDHAQNESEQAAVNFLASLISARKAKKQGAA